MRIYLLGFMGAGKSTVGPLLATNLQVEFVDLDTAIETGENCRIADLFVRTGEAAFRAAEARYLRRTASSSDAVVALGGGAYVSSGNRDWVETSGVSVWLKASMESLKRRVRDDGGRPLFGDAESFLKLYQERRPIYSLARVHMNTDDRSPFQVASDLAGILEHL